MNTSIRHIIPLLIAGAFWLLLSCNEEPPLESSLTGYPESIGEIVVTDCAIPGCHNNESYETAGGLNMETWDDLFKGSNGGSAVIPYRSDLSFLCYFINTDPTTGISLNPTMPFGREPLLADQVQLIRDWIDFGAPDRDGKIMFADKATTRSKFYVANQGCDLVFAFDMKSKQILRAVDIGEVPGFVEAPHMLKVAPDGKYWYAVFLNGSVIQRFSTTDESFQGSVNIGTGNWNTLSLSPDGKYGFAVDFSGNFVAIANLEAMTALPAINLPKTIHGSIVSPDGTRLYVTQQFSNGVYVLDVADPAEPDLLPEVDLHQGVDPPIPMTFNPHEVAFTPDGSRFLVTCEGTNEVRIFNTADHTLVDAITTGIRPQEITFSEKFNLAFVSCMDDTVNVPSGGRRGSVAIIDYTTPALIKHLHTGHEPHGLAAYDQENIVIVANRNAGSGGPTPHHTTECGGKNGYITLIDLLTLELVPDFKFEVSVDPYSIAIRE